MRILISILLTLCFFCPSPAQAIPEPAVYSDPIILVTNTALIDTLQPLSATEKALAIPIGPLPPHLRPAIGGNLYAPGNCTWYAKSRRPDLPNNLGNANTWAMMAREQGWDVSGTPRVGSVAVDEALDPYGHVMYVEAVEGDSVTVSEMNVRGLGIVSTSTFHKSKYIYVY